MVGEPQAEPAVSRGYVGRVGVAQVPGDVRALLDDRLDLLAAEGCRAPGGVVQFGLGGQPLGLGLGDPRAYLLGVATGVERGP
jgi:hypothetical protein